MNGLSPLRVELLRLWRTRRLVGLIFVYAFFGFTNPLIARYAAEIFGSALNSGQMQITVADPVPADGMVGYSNNALQIGLMVGLAMLVSACAIDASYPLAIFYRTRRKELWTLLVPRLAVPMAAIVVSFTVGMAAAWYETTILIDTPSAHGTLRLWIAGVVYQLAFAALAFLLTGILRSVGTTTAVAIVLVLLASILASWPSIARWTPVGLMDYPGIYAGTATMLPPILASLGIAVVAIAAGMMIVQRHELRR